MAVRKRAYSESDKQQRQQIIIEAAQHLLTEKGFYAISMDDVAKQAGLAKGTVYLYFKTKEELFLAVFEQLARAWIDEVMGAVAELDEPTSPEKVVGLLVDSIKDKELFTRLLAIKQILIEHNISFERAHTVNVWLHHAMEALDRLVATKLGFSTDVPLHLIPRMYLLVTGLDGLARPSSVSQQVYDAEPSMRALDFETELRNLLLAILNSQR